MPDDAPAPRLGATAVGARFWITWTFGSALGWIVGFIVTIFALIILVGAIYGGDAESVLSGKLVFGAVLSTSFAVGGSLFGFVQWRLLRKRLALSRLWIVGDVVTFALIGALFTALQGVIDLLANEVAHNSVAGVVGGLIQWRLLRGGVEKALWWIPAGWGAAVIAGLVSFTGTVLVGGPSGTLVGSIGAVIAAAAVTGLVMIWLLGGRSGGVAAGTS